MMRLYFRPLPGMTLAVVCAFTILTGLGIWQIHRLHWKLALIASVNSHLSDPPISVERAMALGQKAQYHRVALNGAFENAKEDYLYTTSHEGGPVYHVLTPFRTDKGTVFMVDRGAVPARKLNPKSRIPITGHTRLVGVWRLPDPPGPFTPPPDLARRLWFSHDVKAMARFDGVHLAAPAVIEASAAPNPGGWPKGGQTVVHFRNRHFSYAVTWFGLAGVLLGFYLAYHMSKGRLTFRRKGE